MGKKEKELVRILTDNGIIQLRNAPTINFVRDLLNGYQKDEIFKVYKQ